MAGRSSRRGGGNNNDRIKVLVDQKLSEGLQYEALQLYRGVVSRKSARGDDLTAMAIAEQGIGVLLREGYADSATELGNTLINILSDHELAPTEERLDLIKRINDKYEDAKRAESLADEDRRAATAEVEQAGAMATGLEGNRKVEGNDTGGDTNASRGIPSVGTLQARFLKLAVGWTTARGRRLAGNPELCALLGRCLWHEGNKARGRKYLVLGERPQELCDLILQDVLDEKARDLAVVKGVLQFACNSSLRDANALLNAYSRQASDKPKGLLTFCGLLLKTCEYDAAPVFKKLLDIFRADLSTDEALFGFVEKIGIVYFNVRLRPASMLDNIMGMLGGGMSK